jgi:DNA mismatch repair protein MutL
MIQHLSTDLIRLIAAGEVVQHPTSAAKELIENALDAGATQIDIFSTGAGMETLGVSDNGAGMSAQDLELAWQSHTTSKLASAEDLNHIAHFGFRGEALHSLTQMARVAIRSRRLEDPVAHEIVLEHGQIVQPPMPVAGTVGTKVTVHSLFAGVPARRKPRAASTENKQILQLVSSYALIFPQVTWHLQLDEKSFSWPAVPGLWERAAQHWGSEHPEEFWPVLAEQTWGRVEGLLGHPKHARRSSQAVISVNGRWIEWPRLEQTVKAAFGSLLEAPMHPSWILQFHVPPDQLDPNIHPNKREVRLYAEDEILPSLVPLLQQSLQEHLLRTQKEVLWRVAESAPEQAAGQTLRELAVLPNLESVQMEIAQLNRLYLATHTANGLLLIDQHAAHERVLYEQFLAAWKNATAAPEFFELTPAMTIAVSPTDDLSLQEGTETLTALGWQLEPFGEQHWVIRAVPALLRDRDPASLLRGVLDDLEAELISPSLHPHHHRMLSTLACRSAIKAGQELSQEARRELLRQLAETTVSYTCPHGRPVSVVIPWSEVEEWFHRS